MATEAEYAQAAREGALINEIATIRDMLDPIVAGKIERGHCMAGEHWATGGVPGLRRATIKDAQRICKNAQIRIDRAIREFDEKETC